MGNINVNKNVYDAVKAATYDGWTTSPNVSNSELDTIERAITADSVVDEGEAQLLQALRNHTSFTVSATGQAPYDVDKSLLSFDSHVNTFAAGTRATVYTDDAIHSVPSQVPTNHTGRMTNVFDSSSDVSFADARARFLDVNNWGESGMTSASFQVVGPDGRERSGTPRQGDYIRIDLPGPTGYDWVQVESISNSANEVSFTVRPSKDPTSNSDETHHFFTDEATNTFTLRNVGGQTQFFVNGRNEVANSGALNYLVTRSGNVTGMQTDQWESLGEYVLGK